MYSTIYRCGLESAEMGQGLRMCNQCRTGIVGCAINIGSLGRVKDLPISLQLTDTKPTDCRFFACFFPRLRISQ